MNYLFFAIIGFFDIVSSSSTGGTPGNWTWEQLRTYDIIGSEVPFEANDYRFLPDRMISIAPDGLCKIPIDPSIQVSSKSRAIAKGIEIKCLWNKSN